MSLWDVKKDGWQVRLQNWTFGKVEPMNNFCPFFWLTIFCLMVSPFVGAWKTIKLMLGVLSLPFTFVVGPVEKVIYAFSEWLAVRYDSKLVSYVDGLDNWEAYCLFKRIYGWSDYYRSLGMTHATKSYGFFTLSTKKQKHLETRWNAWTEKNSDWSNIILNQRKMFEHKRDEKEKVELARKNKLYNIAEKTKILIWLPLGAGAIYLVYGLGLLFLIIRENLLMTGYVVGGIAGVLATAALIIYLGVKFTDSDLAKTDVGVFFKKVFGPVKDVFGFFWMNLKAFKENYCPQINWID